MTAWLLTWLWQGTALVVALSLLLRCLPRVNASTRCAIWWGAFAALAWLGWESSPNTAIAIAAVTAAPPAVRGQAAAVQVAPLPAWALTSLLTAWITIALFRLLRILPGVHLLYRLKDECRPFPRRVEEQLPLWREAGGRRVRLMLCDRLPGAAVLGLLEPYIALPSWLVHALSAADLDQVILHEYGHVQRRDDWARLLQALVQAALWIHPASALIGRELDLEREVACDDWVIARTGAPRDYAGCLSRVAEHRRGAVEPALAPALFSARRDLVRRVDRLLDARRNARHRPSASAAIAGLSLVAVCAAHLSAFPLVTEAAEAAAGIEALSRPLIATSAIATVAVAPPAARVAALPAEPRRGMDVPVRRAPAATPDTAPAFEDAPVANVVSVENVLLVAGPAEIQPPVILAARSFPATYQPVPPDGAAAGQPSPWQRAGSAGVAVGTAARKAGVGMASAFTRAGVSIGRSF